MREEGGQLWVVREKRKKKREQSHAVLRVKMEEGVKRTDRGEAGQRGRRAAGGRCTTNDTSTFFLLLLIFEIGA
jgi:hypothetical protein